MGVSAPVVCLQDVLSSSLSDGNLQLDDQHVSADRLQSAAVGEVESAGESSRKGEKQDEAEDRWVLLLVGGCSRNYHPFTVTASSCPRPPGSRLTLQRPFALGELFIHQTGRLATGQLMILPPQWDTLSLSAVRQTYMVPELILGIEKSRSSNRLRTLPLASDAGFAASP